MFTPDFHLVTLTPFLSATAQLHPKVAIKSIVIAMIDRLASYAAKEAENEPPEERRRGEDEAKRKLEREVQRQRDRRRTLMEQEQRQRDLDDGLPPPAMSAAVQKGEETEGWGAAVNVLPPGHPDADASRDLDVPGGNLIDGQEVKPIGADGKVRKFRGIPEDVKLFEVFWQQVVNLIKVGYGTLVLLPKRLLLTRESARRPDPTCRFRTSRPSSSRSRTSHSRATLPNSPTSTKSSPSPCTNAPRTPPPPTFTTRPPPRTCSPSCSRRSRTTSTS